MPHTHVADELDHEDLHHGHTQGEPNSGSGIGLMIGLVLLILLGFLFFVYGVPAIRTLTSPQVNVPDKVDVNVNQ